MNKSLIGFGLALSIMGLAGIAQAGGTSSTPGQTTGPAAGTPTTMGGASAPGAPVTPHQQQTVKEEPKETTGGSTQPAATSGPRVGDMPATPHQTETVKPDVGKARQ